MIAASSSKRRRAVVADARDFERSEREGYEQFLAHMAAEELEEAKRSGKQRAWREYEEARMARRSIADRGRAAPRAPKQGAAVAKPRSAPAPRKATWGQVFAAIDALEVQVNAAENRSEPKQISAQPRKRGHTLSAQERAACKAKGVDPELYASIRAAIRRAP